MACRHRQEVNPSRETFRGIGPISFHLSYAAVAERASSADRRLRHQAFGGSFFGALSSRTFCRDFSTSASSRAFLATWFRNSGLTMSRGPWLPMKRAALS